MRIVIKGKEKMRWGSCREAQNYIDLFGDGEKILFKPRWEKGAVSVHSINGEEVVLTLDPDAGNESFVIPVWR